MKPLNIWFCHMYKVVMHIATVEFIQYDTELILFIKLQEIIKNKNHPYTCLNKLLDQVISQQLVID